jgi:hypothetical protein
MDQKNLFLLLVCILKLIIFKSFLIVNNYLHMDNIVEIMLNFIDSKFNKKRKVKIVNEECLYWVIKVLVTGLPWNHITSSNCHFSTIYKRFRLWTTEDIFLNLWKELIINYQNNILKTDSKWFKTMFIDSTMIKNVQGYDCLGKNHFDRNRLATKVSLIVDKESVPLSCSFYPANEHDVTTIDNSINNIIGQIKRRKSKLIHNLVGDKGYITNKQNKVKKHKHHTINIVTPYRKNQKQQTTVEENTLLQSRYIIENVFCRLKKFDRIAFRRDRSINSFKSFFYLGLVILTLENIKA